MAYNSTHTGAEIDAAVDLVNSQKQELTPLKLNKCKIRVGDKITALYIGNPQGENYTDSGEQTNVIEVTDEKGNTYNLIDSFGHHNTYKNSVFTGGDVYDVGSQSHIIADWSLIKLAQRLVFGGGDSMNTNRNLILYFTEPLKIVSAPTSNSHFDEDFQGIAAFTNTDRVNTGTFDPTSDNPAGQKSITDFIISADLSARWSRVGSGNISGAFSGLSSLYNGKFHLTRSAPFLWGNYCEATQLFASSNVSEIDHATALDDVFNHAGSMAMIYAFANDYALTTISATYSLSKVNNLDHTFQNCGNLKTIKLRDFSVSFDISASTRFEEADLVEIIGNLADLTGKASQTLTMGAANLAKLTDAEKAVAVNKNWVLA